MHANECNHEHSTYKELGYSYANPVHEEQAYGHEGLEGEVQNSGYRNSAHKGHNHEALAYNKEGYRDPRYEE